MLICCLADGPVLITALGSGEAVWKLNMESYVAFITAQPQLNTPLWLFSDCAVFIKGYGELSKYLHEDQNTS